VVVLTVVPVIVIPPVDEALPSFVDSMYP